MKKDIHIELARAVKESGVPIATIARKLSVARNSVYNWCNGTSKIKSDTLYEIGLIIGYDFSGSFGSEMDESMTTGKGKRVTNQQLRKCWEEKNTLQVKYIMLLEKYNSALETITNLSEA